jgi:hypothetical protein
MERLERQLGLESRIAEMRIKEFSLIRKFAELEQEDKEIGSEDEDAKDSKKTAMEEAEACLEHVRKELQALLIELEKEEAEPTAAHPRQTLITKKLVKEEQRTAPEQVPLLIHSNHHASRTLARPQTFKKGDDICVFLERFQQFVKLSKLQDPELDLYLLNFIDDDTTYKKLRNIRLSTAQKADVKKLVAAVKETLYPATEARILRSTLATLRQRGTESIEAFAARIDDTATKAFSDLSLREEASISTLISGISDISIRQKLLEADVDIFERATRKAVKLERISAATVNTESRGTLGSGDVSDLDLMPVYTVQNTTPNTGYSNFQNSGFNNLHCQKCGKKHKTEDCWRDLICTFCQRRGHPAQVCRRAAGRGPGFQTQGSRSAPRDTRTAQVTCWRCNEYGHYSRQCTSDRLPGNNYRTPGPNNSLQQPRSNYQQYGNNSQPHSNSQQYGSSSQRPSNDQQQPLSRSQEQQGYLNGLAAASNPVQSSRVPIQ